MVSGTLAIFVPFLGSFFKNKISEIIENFTLNN
jgi:hypothetical protein